MRRTDASAHTDSQPMPFIVKIVGGTLVTLFLGTVCLSFLRSCLAVPAEEHRGSGCRTNLGQIAKAMAVYAETNGGFFPFHERGPLASLALLYPQYVDGPRHFACSNASGNVKQTDVKCFPAVTPLAGQRCDYGYTWRASESSPPYFAVLADMPRNHAKPGGHFVLYVDGHVSWQTTPFCSADPADNIFAPEPGWGADTDAWIRQTP